jgi:hypothetical protein
MPNSKSDPCHSERSEAESRLQRSGRSPRGQAFNPVAMPSANSGGSFDSAQDDNPSLGVRHSFDIRHSSFAIRHF